MNVLNGTWRVGCAVMVAAGALLSGKAEAALVGGPDFLGTAASFAVLGGSAVTNTGPSFLGGDLGVWPNNAITGFPPGIVSGSIYAGNAVAQQAQADALNAYNVFAGMAPNANMSGTDLGGLTLTPGVYFFSSSSFLTGQLTLDAQGDPNALFIFQIGSTLISASDASVLMINEANGCNVYWQVGSSATLGTNTAFTGTILANTSVTLNTGADVDDGRVIALNGAVTLDTNTILPENCIPGPGALVLLTAGVAGAAGGRRRRSSL